VLSFTFVRSTGTTTINMLHAAERVNGTILWANNHLLFWLSLVRS